jgi:flagellar protein FliS
MEKQKYQAYAAATQTVARTKQIVMLYEGVIRFVVHAKEAIQENRIEDRYNTLVKASDVLMGLQACLDFENGGHIAKVLYSFYSNIDSRIFLVHRTNSIETCDEIISEMKKMRDVWQEIDASNAGAGMSETPSAPPASSLDQSITLSA